MDLCQSRLSYVSSKRLRILTCADRFMSQVESCNPHVGMLGLLATALFLPAAVRLAFSFWFFVSPATTRFQHCKSNELGVQHPC